MSEEVDFRSLDAILVRYGEIGIKSDSVRSRYEHKLIGNIKGMLSFCAISYDTIIRDYGRIFVVTKDAQAAHAVANVFGVVSTSPVQKSEATLDAMQSAAVKIVTPLLTDGKSFGIRARRTGEHDYSSKDISEIVGSTVQKATGAPVQLAGPDVQLFVEVRANSAYLFTKVIPGVGGLPLGTQGKLIALISGGIDSPVAAWTMMKRGCMIAPVFFDCEPYLGETARHRAESVVRALAAWAGRPLNFAVVNHGACLREFKAVAPRLTCVLCKRMMYRVAASIAREEHAHGIVTGESIGQVASQTTQNLLAIDEASSVPVYRPLAGLDKTESINLARRISTYGLSTAGNSLGCAAAHRHPTTSADQEDVKRYETELLCGEWYDEEVKSLTWDRAFPDESFRRVFASDL